jgi:histidine triad (HIT) family protein
MECAFCNNPDIDARTITDTGLARAFPTFTPVVLGHTIIAPKRHVQYYEELGPEEKAAIEDLRTAMHGALKKTFGAEGFNYAWNEEEIGGQSVPHFHLHMLPRKQGDAGIYGYEPRDFLYRTIPADERPKAKEAELIEVAAQIRQAL